MATVTAMAVSPIVRAAAASTQLQSRFLMSSLNFLPHLAFLVFSQHVCAQSLPTASRPVSSAQTPIIGEPSSPGSSAGAPGFRFVPILDLRERFTDNLLLATSALAQSDWTTDLAVGARVDYRAARASLQLDYLVNRRFHQRSSGFDNTQRQLSSNANVEAIEKWLFLDARASITQQYRSAFGVVGVADIAAVNANRVETTTYQLTPSIRGYVGGDSSYQLRINAAETRTGDKAFPPSRTYDWTGFLNGTASGRLGWSVDATSFVFDNSSVGKRQDSRFRGAGIYQFNPQLQIALTLGREISDLDGGARRTTGMRGIRLEWRPSGRTQFFAESQKRFFGNSQIVQFSHRMPRSALRFSSSKEIAAATTELASSGVLPLGSTLANLLASNATDPNDLSKKLEQTGIPNASGFQNGFLAARPFLGRRDEASFALLGLRNTLTLSANRREQRALGNNGSGTGLAAPIEEIRQTVANAVWAYRLTPISTVRIVVSRLRANGLFLDNLSTTQRFQSVFFVTQIGSSAAASVGVQHVLFDSTKSASYRENAFISTLSIRF